MVHKLFASSIAILETPKEAVEIPLSIRIESCGVF